MRLVELEIDNVRGIRHLLLKPDGKNFLVWGPNGAGKSAVVDAIDFLLTGRVSRLTGRGTRAITLGKHGPHIDCAPHEAEVRAIVKLPDLAEPVEIRRCMADPDALQCPGAAAPHMERLVAFARRGQQHVLTRREILKYITAEAATRAQEIQELLNITEIEDIRRALVTTRNDLDRERQTAEASLATAQADVNATLQQPTYSEEVVLQVVNESRAVLGGQPVAAPRSSDLKVSLRPPTVVAAGPTVNVTLFEGDVKNLVAVTLSENQARAARNDQQLRDLIAGIRSDPALLRALSRAALTQLGISLIDETGNCPLCDTPWPPGDLRKYLEQRLSTAQIAAGQQESITRLSGAIAGPVNNTIASLQKVIGAATLTGLDEEARPLRSWLGALQTLSSALSVAIEKYPDPSLEPERVSRMLAPDGLVDLLGRIGAAVEARFPEATPEQTAWDTLTRLEENLKALERAQDGLALTGLHHRRAALLLDAFLQARDYVLGALYEQIRDRFVDLYRQLHGPDEDQFTATIQPDRAGLNFEVDFYGRGAHPPHALHSEGHQDSMGLCLYLALADHLSEGLIDLIILDDVVMSVDNDHRRQVCHVLATSFPGRQFLITTHDKTWANQLRSEGVVNSAQILEFYNWNIDTGPRVSDAVDMWDRIKEDLQKNDVPAAAARLRRGLEQFFAEACDALQAEVTFKLDGRWELRDFLPAAMARLRSLTKQAKNAANSWGDKDRLDMLQEFDSTVSQIYARSNAEQWGVNPNVHYCRWADFGEKDFRPVVEAFQDLCGLFVCGNCGTLKRLATTDTTPASLRCNCAKVDWNLIEKPKSH